MCNTTTNLSAFSDVKNIQMTSLRAFWRDGDSEHFGLLLPDGTMLVDNILTKYYEPFGSCMIIERDGKKGVIELVTMQVVAPEYDDIDIAPGEYVTFTRNSVEGRVDQNGKFYTLDETDQLDLPNGDIDLVYDNDEYTY